VIFISRPKVAAKVAMIILMLMAIHCAMISRAEPAQILPDPILVVRSYLRATYARDFADAYRVISSTDHKVRDLNKYLQHRGPY
jgi:hypothetical protein